MATVIDSLLVTLGLDPKGFKKGVEDSTKAIKPLTDAQKKQTDEETKQAKQREQQAKIAAQGIAKIRNEVLGLAAAYIGTSAIKSFVERITESDARLGFFSRNVGMSTQDLSAWQGVAEKTGGSAQGLAGDFRAVTSAVERFGLTGKGGESFQYWRALGINLTDVEGKARSMNDVMLEAADKFKGMDPVKAQALGAGMGLSEGTVNTLLHGRKALLELLEAQRAQNAVTEKDAEQAQGRVKAWKDLMDTFQGIGRTVLNALSPALVKLLETLQRFAPEVAVIGGVLAIAMTGLSALKFLALISGISGITAGLSSAGIAATGLGVAGAAATGTLARGIGVASAAATGLLGILGKIFGLLGVGMLADAALSAIDPGDKMGAWIDKHIPGASWIDNAASKVGVGRSYEEQARIAGRAPPIAASASQAPAAPAQAPAPLAPVTPGAESTTAQAAPGAPGTPAAAGGANAPLSRGLRNMNPGNLDFRHQEGAELEQHATPRFARFKTMEDGISAFARQMQLYASRGQDTVRSIISKYAPPNENNTVAYMNGLAKSLGVGVDQHMAPGGSFDDDKLRTLMAGVSKIENSKGQLSLDQINAGIRLYRQRSAVRTAAPQNTSTTDVKVGQVIVHTKATDANGIARDMGQALKNYSFATQANLGLS